MQPKAIVVDANMVIRAVLRKRVREIIAVYAEEATILVPDPALVQEEKDLAALVAKRGGSLTQAIEALRAVASIRAVFSKEVYGEHERGARGRLEQRDPEDRPIHAAAMAAGCPIWTEDRDFFGCGVATWSTANVERFWGES